LNAKCANSTKFVGRTKKIFELSRNCFSVPGAPGTRMEDYQEASISAFLMKYLFIEPPGIGSGNPRITRAFGKKAG